jgi:hypothetical protein
MYGETRIAYNNLIGRHQGREHLREKVQVVK